MSKKLHEFSEEEFAIIINQLPIFIAKWMREVGIRPGSEINNGNDIYDEVKKVIAGVWQKSVELYGEEDQA